MAKTELEISWGSLWRVFMVFVFGAALLLAKDALLVLALAIIISSALDSPVAFLKEKLKIPRLLGTASIFVVGIMLIALIMYIVIPVITLEMTSLAGLFSGTAAGSLFNDLSSIIKAGTSQFSLVNLGQITDMIFKGTSPVVSTIGNILNGVAFGFSVLIISFYLTLTKDGVGRFLRAVLPDRHEEGVLAIYERSKKKIARWLQAQLMLSVVIGILVSGGLWALGVKYSLVIGLLAALFEIMPVVGPIFSGAVGTLIALSTSFTLGMYTLLLFVVIQQLENHLLVPLFMKKVVDVHPVVALFSLLVGFQLLGIPGMIISVPVAVVVQDIIETRARKKILMRKNNEEGKE